MSVVNITGGSVAGLEKLDDIGPGATSHLQGRKTGYRSGLSNRYELIWVAGETGRPQLNALVVSTDHAVPPPVDKNFEVLGNNMTSALCTMNAEGGIKLTTAGADGDEAILLPHLDTDITPWQTTTWGTDEEVEWECEIKTGSLITDQIVWAGLKLTQVEVTVTDANQVFFRYENGVNSGKWQAIDSIADTDTATDTGITVVASTKYHFSIKIDDSRIARFYVNGVLVKTSAALTTNIDFIPYIGCADDGSTRAANINVYGQAISRVAS